MLTPSKKFLQGLKLAIFAVKWPTGKYFCVVTVPVIHERMSTYYLLIHTKARTNRTTGILQAKSLSLFDWGLHDTNEYPHDLCALAADGLNLFNVGSKEWRAWSHGPWMKCTCE